MTAYTVEQVAEDGSPYAFAMLLRALDRGESFVTYGAIKTELEFQLGIQTIFTTHMGAVAGAMMNRLLDVEPNAPLINVLICRPNGVPGRGAAGYLSKRYRAPTLNMWASMPHKKKLELVEKERMKILAFRDWQRLGNEAFGNIPSLSAVVTEGAEHDFNQARGGEAESAEHKQLRLWVLMHPECVGINSTPESALTEAMLLSGDEVDVLFRSRGEFFVIEVKSRRSNEADFIRGIYQCVKYRAVKQAEHAPFSTKVNAVLITETTLPNHLRERATLLGISWVKVEPS